MPRLPAARDGENPPVAEPGSEHLSVGVGAIFGHYVIERMLGRGGMGEVFAARDTQLDRTVALKFLSAERAGSRSAINRLISEAKAASSLNHPNIVTVYEVLREGPALTIAMELVEGITLRDLCGEPQAAVRVIDFGRQTAAALATVHAHEIIYRDVKPENIMLRTDGLIKILDFGLARELSGTAHSSTAGLPVGTLRYMSPEQTRGETLTSGSDVFSLGIILYESLTGQHPFASDSPFSTAHAIAAVDPLPPSSLAPGIPVDLESLVMAMLAKKAEERPTAGAIAQALDQLVQQGWEPARGRIALSRKAGPKRHRGAIFVLIGAAALAIAVALLLRLRNNDTDGMPEILPFTTMAGEQLTPGFSPDSRTVVFADCSEIEHRCAVCTQPLNGRNETCLTGPEVLAYSPVWSPDGKWIAYVTGKWGRANTLWTRSPATGERRKLADVDVHVWPTTRSLAWTRDSRNLLVSEDKGISLIPLSGRARTLPQTPPVTQDYDPDVASDGRELEFTRNSNFVAQLYHVPLNNLAAMQSIPVSNRSSTLDACWAPQSRELIVASGTVGEILRISLDGQRRLLARDVYKVLTPAVSPDGRHIVYVQDHSAFNIWSVNLRAAHPQPVRCDALSSTRDEFFPQYAPDGQTLVFESNRSGYEEIWVSQRDGRDVRQLTHFAGPQTGSPYWSPDGKSVTLESRAAGLVALFVVPAGGGAAVPICPKGMNCYLPSWSHDGQWIYFVSNASGRDQVWRMKPDGSPPAQHTHGGGSFAIDSLDGRSLYYLKSASGSDGIWKMSFETGEEVPWIPGTVDTRFSVARSGVYYLSTQRGVVIRKQPYDSRQSIEIVDISKATLGVAVRNDEGEAMVGVQDTHSSQLMLVNLRP
jgi:Tol biopolymer transport system component